MDTEQPNAEMLVIYPPIILGTTPNVIPYTPVPPGEPVEGAPKQLFTPVLNQQGVLANGVKVLIDPPTRTDPSDTTISIELWLNGEPLENRPIPIADRDQPTEFTLFESLLRDGINNRLEYKIYRPSGNVADSQPLWLIYSAELPGGNIVPGDGEHPYLEINLPAELGNPPVIGKDDVDNGVALTVFYPYMKAYDVITVELRRERFTFTVQPGQEGQPVVITLTRTMFEQAGNSADFTFSYTVVDQLRNPTERRRWSKTLKADVDVNRTVLNAPILREDLADSTDDPQLVDRDKLKGGPLSVVVLAKAPQFAVNDRVEGRFTGTPSNVDVPFAGIIESDGFGGFKPCVMQIPNDKVVLDDGVRASYTLFRNGIAVGTSKSASARVIGNGLEVEDFESVPLNTKLQTIGQSFLSDKFKVTLRSISDSRNYVQITANGGYAHFRGHVLFPYVAFITTTPTTYDLEFRSGTASRIVFWMVYGNITSFNDSVTVYFLNSAGQTLHSLRHQFNQANHGNELRFDSGTLNGIKIIRFATTGQFMVDYFEITR